MIRVYTISQGKITQHKNPTFKDIVMLENMIWIDLQSPTREEKEFVEKNYSIEFFTSQELQEIESSSRFIETDETIEMNLGFLSSDAELSVQSITFILKGNSQLWTLLHLKYNKHFKAEHGKSGGGGLKTGGQGNDTYIEVPVGTLANLGFSSSSA